MFLQPTLCFNSHQYKLHEMKNLIHKMKTTSIIAFVLLSMNTIQAQDEGFKSAMLNNIEKSKSVQSINDLQDLANSYARIAEAEKNEWTAWYYAALCNLQINFQDRDIDRKEKFLVLAQQQIETGLRLTVEWMMSSSSWK